MRKFKLIPPTEKNSYCMFDRELEENPLILFHSTKKQNLDSIISNGFLSAEELGKGVLQSVSYAKKSSGCLANKGTQINEDLVVFAVKFESLSKTGIKVNEDDIHVYLKDLQPTILGYCELPKGYRIR